MTNILVLHHALDSASAGVLARALADAGFRCPILREPHDHTAHPAELAAALNECAVAIVLWSESSAACPRFAALARAAWAAGKQCSVRGPDAAPPAEFARPAPLEISDWDGDLEHPDFKRLGGLLLARGAQPALVVRSLKRSPGWERSRSVANVVAGAMVGFAGALFASPLADSSNPAAIAHAPLPRVSAPTADVALTSFAPAETAFIPPALADRLWLGAANGVTTLTLAAAPGAAAPRAFFLDHPARFVIDIPQTQWPRQGRGEGVGLASFYRYANQADGRARLVLDLAGPARLSEARLDADGRYVFELSALASPPAREAQAAPAPGADAPLIVIDAGHGGRDVGVIGPGGVYEKDLTLAAALSLRGALAARGYEVALTRGDDAFVSLHERVGFARGREAALMISLHADAEPSAQAHGASVYTLSPDYAVTLDARADDAAAFGKLDAILKHARDETPVRSAAFGRLALDRLGASGAPLLQEAPKHAGFVVLQAPDVPSVLIEMGFLTQAEDVERLENPVAQSRFVHALTDAVDAHFAAERLAAARRLAVADACDASAVCLGAARFTF
ncbi:MAG: N-acetylmuramoyl-L-alanine amidase [Hyphomonadaceae bacterium]|nr:N-acetylmuramoyl-L-alanine amidase [Hyphomonadaceae bacterium]